MFFTVCLLFLQGQRREGSVSVVTAACNYASKRNRKKTLLAVFYILGFIRCLICWQNKVQNCFRCSSVTVWNEISKSHRSTVMQEPGLFVSACHRQYPSVVFFFQWFSGLTINRQKWLCFYKCSTQESMFHLKDISKQNLELSLKCLVCFYNTANH